MRDNQSQRLYLVNSSLTVAAVGTQPPLPPPPHQPSPGLLLCLLSFPLSSISSLSSLPLSLFSSLLFLSLSSPLFSPFLFSPFSFYPSLFPSLSFYFLFSPLLLFLLFLLFLLPPPPSSPAFSSPSSPPSLSSHTTPPPLPHLPPRNPPPFPHPTTPSSLPKHAPPPPSTHLRNHKNLTTSTPQQQTRPPNEHQDETLPHTLTRYLGYISHHASPAKRKNWGGRIGCGLWDVGCGM